MPLTLNVGLSRKVGEANYGSRGASVNLELELESGLVSEPERLHDRIRQLFRLAKESINEELNGATNGDNSNGTANNACQPNGRQATQSQVRAIHAIANRQRADLLGLLRDRFQVSKPDDLSITAASQLIDQLKSESNGAGDRR